MIPEHETYCEVFAGAAWVMFKKPQEISKVEIINDINRDLTNLYQVVKYHLEEFIKTFKWMLIARDEYEKLKEVAPETLTDVQRAVRFYYLLRLGFGAKIDNFSFTPCTTRNPRINLLRIEEDLSEAHLRLSKVYVENLNYDAFIKRYDRPHTFFYIDPPYRNCESDYGKNVFCKADFIKLRDILADIKGKFLLSLNDTPEIREIFKQFDISEVSTRYSVTIKNNKKITELLIKNY